MGVVSGPAGRSGAGLLALLALAAVACGAPGGGGEGRAATVASSAAGDTAADAHCAEPFDPAVEPYPVRAEMRHARHVSVRYEGWAKVVTLLRPGAAVEDGAPAPGAAETLVLLRCGAPLPELPDVPLDAPVIRVPVRTVATNGVADLARLRELGLAERVVGVPGGYVYDDELHRRFAAGELVALGHPGHGRPDLEALLDRAPELVVLFSPGPEHAQAILRARELGLSAVPTYAFAEGTVLGQAEWLKFLALFFDAEARAEAVFAEVEERYRDLSARARRAAGDEPPRVLWGGPVGGNRWWVEQNGPAADLIADAGAVNPLADADAGPFATLETAVVLDRAGEADLWLTDAVDAAAWDGRIPLDALRPWRQGRTFHNRKRARPERDAWDWNETAQVRPDLQLADLVSLLHPALLPNHEPRFFAPVGGQPAGSRR